jgi:hypothetical protein
MIRSGETVGQMNGTTITIIITTTTSTIGVTAIKTITTMTTIYLSIYLSIYGSTALVDFGRFFSFLIYTQSVGLLGRGGSDPRKACTYTQNNTNTE